LNKNIFGQYLIIKKAIIRTIGVLTHKTFNNKRFNIQGTTILNEIPKHNVLFISNHQTYFYDVIAMLHVFNASVNGRRDSLKNILYLLKPKSNIYFIAALETMKASVISKILSYAGSILIKRTWREAGKEITRNIRSEDFDNIIKALNDGWVITFPRGTTDNSKPVRSGTAYIIKQTNPIVIPVKIDGFGDVFERNSLKIKNKTKPFSIKFGNALKFNDNESIESITNQIEKIID
jgi:1-acyl-sn-glycerol-3-phosphate acyltransferase